MKATIRSSPWLRLRASASLSGAVVGTLPDGAAVDLSRLLFDATGAPTWGVIPAVVHNAEQGIPISTETGAPVEWYLSARWLDIAQPPAPNPATPTSESVQMPYFSQVGNPFSNDCGPACWCMLASYAGVRTTVEALVRLMGVANKLTTSNQAVTALTRVGLRTVKGSHILRPPFMCLVSYPKLPARYLDYDGLHFIVVTGIDRNEANEITRVVYHDPLWPTPSQGAYRRMTVPQFHAAEAGTHNRVSVVIEPPVG
ncbi:MAG: hypothetical protein IT323_13595 [Anaerolineae bacterium]|nr:hypothetical protein [Anaerolineae bacterium]